MTCYSSPCACCWDTVPSPSLTWKVGKCNQAWWRIWCPCVRFDGSGWICALPQPNDRNTQARCVGGVSSLLPQWAASWLEANLACLQCMLCAPTVFSSGPLTCCGNYSWSTWSFRTNAIYSFRTLGTSHLMSQHPIQEDWNHQGLLSQSHLAKRY